MDRKNSKELENNKNKILNFIFFIRRNYFFPIRLNIAFCNQEYFKHHIDNHKYYAAFYGMDDENRKTYPSSPKEHPEA